MQRLDSDKVFKFLGAKTRSTSDVATHFKVSIRQASAAISILRIKGTVVPASPAKDANGLSLWQRKN